MGKYNRSAVSVTARLYREECLRAYSLSCPPHVRIPMNHKVVSSPKWSWCCYVSWSTEVVSFQQSRPVGPDRAQFHDAGSSGPALHVQDRLSPSFPPEHFLSMRGVLSAHAGIHVCRRRYSKGATVSEPSRECYTPTMHESPPPRGRQRIATPVIALLLAHPKDQYSSVILHLHCG